jgi:chromosomal replication initiator protein
MSQATTRLGMQSAGLIGAGRSPARGGGREADRSAIVSGTKSMGFVQPELPFSFDNFVVGPCNSLAREAAFAVAGGQQLALKQLYLAAAPGLGKTHLAKAVAVEVAKRSGRPVRYANAEIFTNEFVAALRTKETAEFKRRYRPGEGLLVLEDVQFLAAKRATQLEFFHSVQHVIDAGGRVLLTGDRMPQEMPELEERVREQLSRGFVARIEMPDATVRRQILRMKASNGGIRLPEDCLDLLVDSVQGNVRELEGVLMQVVTTSTLLKRPIDLELTERSIAQKVRPAEPSAQRPGVADVLTVVASFFQTSSEELAARSRRRDVLVPRQLAMYLCHRHTDAPLAEIGRALGRDHPSVRNAIRKIEREILENARLRYQVEALTTRIRERSK